MNFFDYGKTGLMAEGVSVTQIAREVGTPLYIYSQKTLQRHFSAFANAFATVPHLICYSVKANSNLAVLRTFSDQGSGFDIVSGGELYRVIKAGADASKIVFFRGRQDRRRDRVCDKEADTDVQCRESAGAARDK